MSPTPAVDAERLTIDYLHSVTALDALVGDRIYSAVPAAPTFPLVRVVRIGGSPTSRVNRLDNPLLQIDVWGGPKATAHQIAALIRAHMAEAMPGSHALGAVTAVETGSLAWLPDGTYDPAKPRYSWDVSIWTHP